MDFAIGFALFDRTSIGTKLSKLRHFMDFQADDKILELFATITASLEKFISIRNHIAHGIIVGMRDERIIFLLTADYTDNIGSFTSKAMCYSETELHTGIALGRECIRWLRNLFGVKPLHETIDYTVLQEKPISLRAQRKNSPSKDRPPPQSSGA